MDRVDSPSSEWLGARTSEPGVCLMDSFCTFACFCIPSALEYISAYLHLPRTTMADALASISLPDGKSCNMYRSFCGARHRLATNILSFTTYLCLSLVKKHELTRSFRSYFRNHSTEVNGTHSSALAESNGKVLRITCREQGSRISLSNLLASPRHVERRPTGRNGRSHGDRFRHMNSPHAKV